jgi:PAS domain S-box-containing protein
VRKDGALFFADGVTTVLRDDTNEIIGFSKIARDVTDRIRAERRLAAQLTLTNLLATDQPFEQTARRVMQAICENLGWEIGALWRVDDASGELCPLDIWINAGIDPGANEIIARSETLKRGVGLPGRVWETAEPLWVTAFNDDFPRAPLLTDIGMRSALAFPIVLEGRVLGVMEFFTREVREPDRALLPIMSLIGAQIGDYFERRRTTEALHASEEQYRVISDTAQDAIFTMDSDSRVLFANPAVERIFGYTPADMVGQPLEIIIPPRFREAHRTGVARYLRTGTRHIPWSGIELPALHRDGHEFPVELAFGVFRSPTGQTVFSGFARDITERKRAAEDLRESLEHEQQARAEAESARGQLERRADEEVSFRRLASALTGAVEMDDVLHEITSRATLVARADGVYVERIVSPDGEVEVVSAFGRGVPVRGTRVSYPGSLTEEILESRQPTIVANMRSFGRSMAPYLADLCPECQVLVTPLVADEEALGALVLLNSRASGRTFHDADIQRAKTLGDLTSLALRRVRLMEQEREAREKAEVAVRVRDETLGIVSHDLRNPLTTIALSAQLLANAAPQEQREHVAMITAAAQQMQRLIEDLLDVARVESGRLSVQKARVNASDIAQQACDANTPLAETKKLRLVCDVEPLPEIDADRDRIVQVFGNLIGNALKFTPAGGTVTVRGRPRPDCVVFEVRDTGPGIPESDVKNVFRPYWQAKKTAHMGAGLGLAIVRGIIEAHGGTVRASNAPGGGAVFTFTIPTPK